MVLESLSRRLSRVFNLRYCCAAALYSGAASGESLTLTVLPLALYVSSKYGPWRLVASEAQAHWGLPHFIIRFRTVPLQKYSICSRSRLSSRKRCVWRSSEAFRTKGRIRIFETE